MATFAEYTNNKKKKSAENTTFREYTKSVLGDSFDDDIAPVKTTTGAGVTNKLASLLSVASKDDFKTNSGYVSTKKDGILGRITSRYGMGYDDLQYETNDFLHWDKFKEALRLMLTKNIDEFITI